MMNLMRIERWDVRRDGALTDAALLHKLQALGYEPVRRAYPSGAMAAATIDEEPAILTAGDIVFIPPRTARRIEVVGTTSAFCFEASRDLS